MRVQASVKKNLSQLQVGAAQGRFARDLYRSAS